VIRVGTYILYAPHLRRDIRGILERVHSPLIITGAKTERGCDGCLDSHKAAVMDARARGFDAAFVLEDDCLFTNAFNYGAWMADVEWAAANGYDVLTGGCVQTYHPQIVREGLVACSSFHSAHCVVYLATGFDRMLEHVQQPLDTSLGQDCGLKCLMTYPFVAVQNPGPSGILGHDVNYVPLYEQYQEHLGRALGLRA
jgi:hypothetical protein